MQLEIWRMQHEKHRYTRCDLYITDLYITNYSVYTGIKRVHVQGLKESGLTIRGDEDQGPVSSEVCTRSVIQPNRIVSQSATLWKCVYQAVELEEPSTRPLVLSIVTESYWFIMH